MAPTLKVSDYLEQLEADEATKLEARLQGLTDADTAEIAANGVELLAAQDAADRGDCLPLLQISEIERTGQYYQVQNRVYPTTNATTTNTSNSDGVPIQWSLEPTNGVSYFRTLISTTELPAELHPYLPLFCTAVTSLGTLLISDFLT
jgi:Zn-dependent M16 (insulinase) family peptidase